jgi:hypothetical protein
MELKAKMTHPTCGNFFFALQVVSEFPVKDKKVPYIPRNNFVFDDFS